MGNGLQQVPDRIRHVHILRHHLYEQGDHRQELHCLVRRDAGGLNRLCAFFPQTGTCGKFVQSYVTPTTTSAGKLAGEALALEMNIAYNDVRLMPRTPGYDLQEFRLASGIFKGKKVGEVRDIANQVLGGSSPAQFGLQNGQAGYDQLCDILAQINADYEFVNYNIFNDRGYLIPNQDLRQSGPATIPTVPEL